MDSRIHEAIVTCVGIDSDDDDNNGSMHSRDFSYCAQKYLHHLRLCCNKIVTYLNGMIMEADADD